MGIGIGDAYMRLGRPLATVRISTIVLLLGVALFVLPVPGTFLLAGACLVAGAVLRSLGS